MFSPLLFMVSLYAEPETRTRKSLRTLEPESSASTNSASPANRQINARITNIRPSWVAVNNKIMGTSRSIRQSGALQIYILEK
jgi:hypothetical protein